MPVDDDAALQLQDVARYEVDEDQAGARIAQEIAQGVVEAVAAKVGNDQRVALHRDEARAATTMRHVEAAAAQAGARTAGHEEGVRPRDQRSRRLVEGCERLRPDRRRD